MKKIYILFLLFNVIALAEQTDPGIKLATSINAVRINEQIKIDGILSEKIWNSEPVISTFMQHEPVEGVQPTYKTEVYIAYDDESLYFAAKMYDPNPDSIIARLSRRDDFPTSDRFDIFIDPNCDKRSGYYFIVNAAGTLTDGVLYNDDWDDNSWDAVWEGKAQITKDGWIAEVKIPFSQFSFKDDNELTWGINLRRIIARTHEEDLIIRIPKNESGFVSRFIELKGISNIKHSSNIELLPYVTGRAEYLQHDPEDPFHDGSGYFGNMGADLKMKLSSNVTLNATINPDFGQVEIDPAVINLSDVETYYSEKRPFFIEGSTIFEFGYGGARNFWGFNWSTPTFFYSRRIGRVPQGIDNFDYDYQDVTTGTHILGAAKLTGKAGDGWNVGTIQAVTKREYAGYIYEGNRSSIEVEPLTYYGIARVQKEFNNGHQGLGIISTFTQRGFKNNSLADIINKNAFTGGVDGWVSLDSSKTWVVTGWAGMSNITGTKERIADVQTNSQHYFQRPDAGHVYVDSSRTSLTGYAARVFLVKQKGNSFFNSAIGVINPYFDINDVGFLSRADIINMHAGGGYSWTETTSWTRYAELLGALFRSYDFDKNIIWEGVYLSGDVQFLNYYSLDLSYAYNPQTVSNRRTRGGPLTLNLPGYEFNLSTSTDSRKELGFSLGGYVYLSSAQEQIDYNFGVDYRPSSNITISFTPYFSINRQKAQYIDTFDDEFAVNTYGKRYVFGELQQKTFGAGIRVNWTFNPNLSLQLYVQPLISSGSYSRFKELAKAKSFNFNAYGEGNSTLSYNKEENEFTADPDGSGAAPGLTFDNPDFNYKSLRGNAVLRWEYMPGSVLYLVWTQTRSDDEDNGEFRFGHSLSNMFNARPDNIFAIKFTYWLNM